MAYRKDKEITHEIPHYRRMLAHIVPNRRSAEVISSDSMNLSKTLPWIKEHFEKHGEKLSLVHLYLAAAGRSLHRYPNLNRYCQGYRFFQRDGVYMSVSVKKNLKQGSKVQLIKLKIDPLDTPSDIYRKFGQILETERSTQMNLQDKEMKLFLMLPGFLLSWLVKLVKFLDYQHWLPGFFVDPDPLFTSMVVANLGSVGVNASYHHLYEYGNCPMFAVIGPVEEGVVVEDGEMKVRPVVTIKSTFDERIEDGLATVKMSRDIKELIEDPQRFNTGTTDLADSAPKNNIMSKRFEKEFSYY